MTGFVSFLERKQQLLTNASRLKELVQTHLKDQDTSILENFKREVLEDLSFKILCVGDFSSGKSTFINRFLLQENILPAFAKPTTTRPTKIRFGERLKARLYFQNGEQETITENVAGRLMESVAAGGSDVEKVSHVILESPSTLLEKGIELVDAPGLNDPDAERMKITFDYLHQADAILFFLNAQQPWTRYQKSFFEKDLLRRKDIDKLFMLANYWDQIEHQEREELLEYIKEQLQTSLMTSSVDQSRTIDWPILPVSAKTGENGEEVTTLIWNYLAERKSYDVLAERIKRFNGYVKAYLQRIEEQMHLAREDRQTQEKRRALLQREIEGYKKQRDDFIQHLKKALRPEFEEYQCTVEDLFVQAMRKLRSMMTQLLQEDLGSSDMNIRLSCRLSQLQEDLGYDMNVKERRFQERLKDRIEEQKGLLDMSFNYDLQAPNYFLIPQKVSSYGWTTASVASGSVGALSFLVGAGAIWQTLATPVATPSALAAITTWAMGSAPVEASSAMTLGLPGIAVGIIGVGTAFYFRRRSERHLKEQMQEITEKTEQTLTSIKRQVIDHMVQNRTQNIDRLCEHVDHEIIQRYQQKLTEMNSVLNMNNQGCHLQGIYEQIDELRLRVN